MAARRSIAVPREIFEAFAPALRVSRAFCLQPLAWKRADFNYVVSRSGAYVAYSGLMITFLVVISVVGLLRLYQIPIVYAARLQDNTGRYVTFSDIAVVLVPSVFSVISTVVNLDKRLQYFDHLRKVDSFLQQHPPQSRRYLFVVVVTMFCTLLVLTLDVILWARLSSSEAKFHVIVLCFSPYHLCYFFTMVTELMFWQCVRSIKVRMVTLNGKLLEVLGDENVDSLFMKIDRKKISRIVDTMKVDGVKKQLKSKKSVQLEQIQPLISAYQKLIEAANSVNDIYGLDILLIILGCLIHLLVTPYALYTIMFNTAGNGIFIVSQAMWMSGHVARLLLIVEPCHGCAIENGRSAIVIYKLLCFELERDVREALEFFLQYLGQCKVEFDAFGLTRIDRKMLTTITGAVTTYLVILFQFNK